MAANPFLMEDLNYEAETAVSSNPFLSGMDFSVSEPTNGGGGGENPFLSSMAFEDSSTATVPQTSTNPFADFSTSDYTEPVDFFTSSSETKTNDFTNIFQQETMTPQDIFGKSEETIQNETEQYSQEPSEILKISKPSRPPPPAPMRPPPPRPNPPSKETKDLILSVTGAMEATSSSLLDRLQATRTPSPTPIRDLHSPSPTPDLMGGETPAFPGQSDINLFGEMEEDEVTKPSPPPPAPALAPAPAPPPPSRPSRPPPPPARPAPPVSNPISTTSNEDDLFDIFSSGPAKKPEKVTTSDILGLYNAKAKPAVSPQPTSLLDAEPESLVSTVTSTETTTMAPPVSEAQVITPFGELVNSMADFTDVKSPPTQTEVIEQEANQLLESSQELNNEEVSQSTQDEALTEPFAKSTSSQSVVEALAAESDSGIMPSNEDISQTFLSNEEQEYGENKNVFEETQGLTTSEISWETTEPPAYSDISSTHPFTEELNTFATETSQPFNDLTTSINEPVAVESTNIFGDISSAFGTNETSEIKSDEFDAFAAKFESAAKDDLNHTTGDIFDPFGSGGGGGGSGGSADWGANVVSSGDNMTGFGGDDDSLMLFSQMKAPPSAQATPKHRPRQPSADSDEDKDFTVFIKPKSDDANGSGLYNEHEAVPALAPPPKSPMTAFTDPSSRFNPFDKSHEIAAVATTGVEALPEVGGVIGGGGEQLQRTDSQETPPTPLFDEDVSQPLEDFPRVNLVIDGWEMQLRHPNKKKITGQRFWKKVYVKLINQGDTMVLHLYNTKDDKDPFQELPLQSCYSISDISAQQFDAYGKIFTVKLQYIFYKERPGVRPGQVTKAERITNKLSQFAAYAIQGDYQGCKEFGSDLKKLGLPVEHAPQVSQLLKLGSQNFEDMKQLSVLVEEALFRIPAHRDRALSYKTEEVQITAVDELYVEQDAFGHVDKQIARVRLFFLGFLAGMPDIELGINDMWRQGKEVVGRHDIIPVITEEWIRLENVEFHSCVQQDEYQNTRVIKFKPPDACYIELFRFRIRPPKNRELPFQLKAVMCVTGNKVELKADILIPGYSSRKLGQIPCEDIMVRFPIPECWIYLFRVEKHFRYGSVKSTHRRTGKVKGIERFLGAVETLEQSLMEVTSGQAKYEHQHRSIVWRMARLPKEGQGAYTTHSLVCRMNLTSYDQIPDQLAEYCYVEFTMPATQVSHMTVRSVSLQNGAKDDPPEKYVRYLARHEYRVGIEHTQGEGPGAYISATITKPAETTTTTIQEETVGGGGGGGEAKESDSDSEFD